MIHDQDQNGPKQSRSWLGSGLVYDQQDLDPCDGWHIPFDYEIQFGYVIYILNYV